MAFWLSAIAPSSCCICGSGGTGATGDAGYFARTAELLANQFKVITTTGAGTLAARDPTAGRRPA